jgi:uncharacterized protein (TIRG00374 family)
MRSHARTVAVLALAGLLIAVFLRNVDLSSVGGAIRHAHVSWLVVLVASIFLNLVIRAWRWQYLFEPLGTPTFANSFRATAVGFAARSLLPAAAGELVRPYFLSRRERISATGAFATIVIERLLDTVTVLVLLASYVFFFGRQVGSGNPGMWTALTWSGGLAGVVSIAALAVLFLMAGDPVRFGRTLVRLEQVLPSKVAGFIAHLAEKFAAGLGAVRRPGRLAAAMAWSFPLWFSIALGIWAAAMAFDLAVPFPGTFLLIALLTVGVAVPTPGAVGSFHEAFRIGVTMFFDAPNESAVAAAIVLHALTVGPTLLLGLFLAAQDGLNVAGMRRLAEQAGTGADGAIVDINASRRANGAARRAAASGRARGAGGRSESESPVNG